MWELSFITQDDFIRHVQAPLKNMEKSLIPLI